MSKEDLLQLFLDKSNQIFSPDFFGMYSFEYAYRLLLVYLCTNKTNVRQIRASDSAAFDKAFEKGLKEAISYVLNNRGFAVSKEEADALVKVANDAVGEFILASLMPTPSKVAHNVAIAMDKRLGETLGTNKRNPDKVFSE